MATEEVVDPEKPAPAPAQPPYSQVMPWVLVVCAIGLALAAFSLRDGLHADSVVVVQGRAAEAPSPTTTATAHCSSKTATDARHHKPFPPPRMGPPPGGNPADPSSHAHSRGSALTCTAVTQTPHEATKPASTVTSSHPTSADSLPAERKTTTETSLSDSTFSAMLALAVVLLTLGAFYARVSEITLGRYGIKLASALAAARRDEPAIAHVVAKRVAESGGTPEAVAERTAVATSRAVSRATQLRLAAAVPHSVAVAPADIPATPQELSAMGSGMPIPASLLKRLADKAVDELEQPDG